MDTYLSPVPRGRNSENFSVLAHEGSMMKITTAIKMGTTGDTARRTMKMTRILTTMVIMMLMTIGGVTGQGTAAAGGK